MRVHRQAARPGDTLAALTLSQGSLRAVRPVDEQVYGFRWKGEQMVNAHEKRIKCQCEQTSGTLGPILKEMHVSAGRVCKQGTG